MAQGRMSVVVPVSDVGAVALPILVGVAFLGERPAAVAGTGIAVAVPALRLAAQAAGLGTGRRGVGPGAERRTGGPVSAGVPVAPASWCSSWRWPRRGRTAACGPSSAAGSRP
ncbi:hypothetical protein GCM10010345_61470 [Streptomyces canarius]|uniref:EamA domain-containing protein n=1 Tax=Streptomyces canarius TaxID=285453 RepID=A0ABQ3D004_9ACTN|nr:hypothetical protein GCM10010345_61470 [Streptomyces canarius]